MTACWNRMDSCGTVVAWWLYAGSLNRFSLCQLCLDAWFDGADEDPELEPGAWGWLPGSAPVAA